VPKLKNSAVSAISFAIKAARGQLDHGADHISELFAAFFLNGVSNCGNAVAQKIQLGLEPNQRDHDFQIDCVARFPLRIERGFKDRPRLHLVNLRIADPEPAAAMAQHGIGFRQRNRARPQFGGLRARSFRDLGDFFIGMRNEFVQRRIEQPDGDRQPLHDAEYFQEIAALHRQQLGDGRFAPLQIVGQDHLAYRKNALGVEEHVLRAAEPDALRP
jgi:hypothetical protein